MSDTRRSFFARAAAIATAQGLILKGQQAPPPQPAPPAKPQLPTPPSKRADPRQGTADAAKYFKYFDRRATVSLIKGEDRRKNVYDSLMAIDDQIRAGLKTKKYVYIKPNGNEDAARPLGATRADAVRGILDYLAPRFKGPVMFGDTGMIPNNGEFTKYGYDKVFA